MHCTACLAEQGMTANACNSVADTMDLLFEAKENLNNPARIIDNLHTAVDQLQTLIRHLNDPDNNNL